MNPVVFHILLVIFVATLIRSAFGFGEALIAVPLLVLRIPLDVAAPLAVLMSITVAAIVLVQDWRSVQFRSTIWLVLSTVAGLPIGLWLLTNAHQQVVKAALAILLIGFSLYSLLGRRPPVLHDDHRMWLAGCGFTAGILGGAYGMNGPPLAIYGAMRRWTAQQFRATLQGYFLPASLVGMLGYWMAGLWTARVTRYYLLSLPAAIPAIVLGRVLNQRLRGDSFLKYVYLGLLVIAVVLLAQATAR